MWVVANIHMEKWNDDVLDVSKTIEQLGPRKCSQLLGLHALLGCDTVSYPFGKGNTSALRLLDIYQVLIKCSDNLARPTLSSRRQQTASFSPLWTEELSDARGRFFRSRKKPQPLKKLQPTDANLQLHVLRAHLQMLL